MWSFGRDSGHEAVDWSTQRPRWMRQSVRRVWELRLIPFQENLHISFLQMLLAFVSSFTFRAFKRSVAGRSQTPSVYKKELFIFWLS